MPKCAKGKDHKCGSCSLRLPSTMGWDGTNRGGYQSSLCCEGLATKHENDAGIVRQCFSTSWQCYKQLGTYLCPISIVPTPRESTETPWGVLSCCMQGRWRYASTAHCMQHWELFICIVEVLYTQYILVCIICVKTQWDSSGMNRKCNGAKMKIKCQRTMTKG